MLQRRRLVLLGVAGAAAAGIGAPRRALALQAGQTIPSLMLDTAEGPQPIAPARARVTYVDFWASWCGPCRQSFPWMNDMHGKYGGNGLRIVAVNVDARRDEADEFLARNPARFAIAFDRQRALAQALDVKAMPTSLLLDSRGRVLLVHQGFAGKDREKLEAAIEQALRDSPVAARP
jgi:thiol-disulfide isomerase/thioredoxin